MNKDLDDLVFIEEDNCGIIYYSKINSGFTVVPYGVCINDVFEFLRVEGLLDKVEPSREYTVDTVYICVHISSRCNLNCRYCFKENAESKELNESEIRKFIDLMLGMHPNANRYIIDMSGSGEPLLNVALIDAMSRICHEYSDKYLCEFQPRLVTNGTLLTQENVRFLQDAGVLFGISIDGDKAHHNYNRVDKRGIGSYDKIMENVKQIENKSYIGAAVTLTNENCNITKIIKQLIKYFPTIAIKPVRYVDGRDFDYETINYQYEKFYKFLLRKTLSGDLRYLYSILNGDDYFGKFIFRVYCNLKAQTRCDAAISRLSLSPNGNIYICPSAEDISNFIVGSCNRGLNEQIISDIKQRNFVNEECLYCYARYICGGKCMVDKYYKKAKEDTLCMVNRCLYRLAVKFYINTYNSNIGDAIRDLISMISGYSKTDEKLRKIAIKYRGRYSYTYLKKLRDNNDVLYDTLLKNL